MDDDVFKALADPGRRQLLDSLNARDGQTLSSLCTELDMARQSVSKHLAVLEGANLVTTMRRGREKLHYLNAEPINAIADRWISRYHRARVTLLADLKTELERAPMSDTEFVYTTFILTTPEQLWQALTHPLFTRQYWRASFETDWKQGSQMTWQWDDDVRVSDPAQVVLESDPYRRLAYTWHTVTPELGKKFGFSDEFIAAAAKEPRSQVSFDLEPVGEKAVKLTVVHSGFAPGSPVLKLTSQGWPDVLSSLKTLLETGEPMPA